MIELISDGQNVSADWLGRVLDRAGASNGAKLEAITATQVGSGQMGENVRYELTWSDPDHPLRTVVGKFPSDNDTSRTTGSTGAYQREVRFYTEIAATVDIRVARCYHADVDLEVGDFVLILEDLAPRRQGDQIAGCGAAEAEEAVDQLVGLQAPRWNDPSLFEVEWLMRRIGESVDHHAALYRTLLPGWVDQIGPLVEPRHVDIARRLGEYVAEWIDVPGGPMVVTHGDYRLDNMMFHPQAGLAVVDWQTVSHGAPLNDLSYFMGTGPTPEVRREIEPDIVERYTAGLGAAGVQVQPEWVWEQYRRLAPAGLFMSVVASQIVIETERGNNMFAVMASRSADMAIDHESLDLLG